MALKLEKIIFLSLILSIPFQKRSFLFGPSPEGERFFEWSSGFLYFTDILIIILAISWFKVLYPKFNFGQRYKAGFGPVFLLLAFLGFALVSLTQAELIDVALYRFIKLAEFIFLFFYVATRVKIIGIKPVLAAFIASGIFQSVLAILQFKKQASLGLEVFHESTLRLGMEGVAHISTQGVDMIRAYGTFPSPNVLAGFLGICLIFLFYLFLKGDNRVKYQKEMLAVSSFILSLGLVLTFSRGAIIFFLFISILFFAGIFLLSQFKQYKKQAVHLLVLVIVSWLLTVSLLWPEVSSRFLESSISEPAIQERLFFNDVGVGTIGQNYSHLFLGIGIGNFVNHYMQSLPGLASHLYQPVHNIFILIASEIGILGLIVFVIFLASLFKKSLQEFFRLPYTHDREYSVIALVLLCVMCFMLLIGMYDHYFWTLQQGSLMFWISLGLLASMIGKYNK